MNWNMYGSWSASIHCWDYISVYKLATDCVLDMVLLYFAVNYSHMLTVLQTKLQIFTLPSAEQCKCVHVGSEREESGSLPVLHAGTIVDMWWWSCLLMWSPITLETSSFGPLLHQCNSTRIPLKPSFSPLLPTLFYLGFPTNGHKLQGHPSLGL